ncbi:MAG: PD40 domain-containing protein [Caldilinea sp.]|nr:PD40 domain-containing protein [Caldilinea sp.]
MLSLLLTALLPIGWAATPASALAQTQQTYWLGRLDGTEYVFDTRLPAAVADAIKGVDPRLFVVDEAPQAFPPMTADGAEYSFVKIRLSWDNTMFDRGQISLVGLDGMLGAKWFTREKDSAEGKALAEQLKAQATATNPGGAWHSADLLLLIAPNADAEKPSVRLSIFGQPGRYWLGRPDGTEYLFDTPLPPDFAAKILAADANKYVMDKSPREFPPQTVGGTEYSFVKTQVTYDKPQFDKGELALVRKPGTDAMLWIDGHLNSTVGEPLIGQLPVPKAGEWKTVAMVILVSPNAESPTLRLPIPETTLALTRMSELGEQTQAGRYYSGVEMPADLDAFRSQMLAYGNLGRRDPDFRKNNGSACALDLSADTVLTDKDGHAPYSCTEGEKVFRQSETPPFFADHVLNAALNEAAQFQAEYQASIRRTGHDGPASYSDPKTGKSGNLAGLGDRVAFFGAPANVVEAAGCCSPGDFPHGWMASDSHFRPWFNVDGCYPEFGYGAAKGSDGKWYFAAVAVRDADCSSAAAQATPAATSTATPAAPEAEATPEAPSQPVATPAQADRFPLPAGQTVVRGQKYPSESGNHYLIFQPDGNLVVYSTDDQYAWGLQSVTDEYARAQSVKTESDGNFVVRDANDTLIWSALIENPDPSAYLTLTPQGVLRLVSGATGATLWASDGDLSAAAAAPAPTADAAAAGAAETKVAWQATLVFTDAHDYGFSPWLAWSPDGSKLVAASDDNSVRVWDATTGASLATLTGHTAHVRTPAWSPDGSKIASGSDDGTVRVWDAATGASLATLPSDTSRVMDLAWSPDSSKLASASGDADGIIRVWDAATSASLATLTGHTHYLKSMVWSPDGSKIASTSSDQTVRVWDVATGAALATITNNNSLGTQVAWSPDSSKIASGTANDGTVGVWDATTGASLATLTGHTDNTRDVAWSPDGSKLATSSDDETIRLWDAATNASLATLTGHTSTVGKLAWSPDGSKLASVSAASGGDQAVRIWDVATGASLAVLTGHTGTVSNVAWSPDGSKLASEGDGTVRIWAAVTPATSTPTSTPEPAATPAGTPDPAATPDSTPTATPDPNAIAFEPLSLSFVWEKGSRSNPASQPVLARNVGGVVWHPGQWLNVAGTNWVSGGLQMNISVSPANANLDVGVHDSQLILESNGMSITLPVQLTVVSRDGTLQVNRKRLNFGGFTGDPIAGQAVGVTFTGLNSTNWTATGPSWLTLTPAGGSVSATAPTTLTVGIDTAAIGQAGKYTDTLTVSDGKTTHQIAVELFQVEPGAPTIQLFGLEVTQGIQNLLNEIPFVAERPVFVRGHVRSLTGAPIDKVTAQLVGTRDGAPLGTLNPINPGGSIDIVADPDRAQLNESFLFELPASWRTGTVTLHMVGQSQPIACVDPAEKSMTNGAAADCTVTLTYETVPALPIQYFLYSEQGTINYSDGRRSSTATFTANADHASATSSQLLAGLPIPRVDQQISPTTLTFPGIRGTAEQSKMDAMMRAEHEKAGQPRRHFYGLFARYKSATDPKANVQGGPGGVAVVPGFFGFGEYYTFQPMATLNIHEIGHNLGRSHVGCGNPANPDPSFPHPDQRISDVLSGNEAYFGFNIVNQEIYPPTHKDVMSYCWPQWVSPYTYKAMLERLKIHYDPPAGSSGTGQAAAAPGSPILLVNGSITGAAAGTIDSVAEDNASAALPAPGASAYSVRLVDANGQTIATYPVTPQLAEGQNDEEFTSYTLAIPRPENLARVVLLYNEQELAERSASASAPTLTLTTPAGGESLDSQPLAITWNASDDDGDPLTFNVDYSTDGGATWQKLAWGWPESSIEISSADLPGSTQARIRVAANDGFLTTFAESEIFTVADHAPVAIILSMDLNPYYVGGQTIRLEGAGYDLEDGLLSDLTWYSDRDGVLGTGPVLALEADALAEGTHLIRLEAKDSQGQSSVGDSAADVAEGAVANDTVSFDVLYDPLTLPPLLAVTAALDFSAAPGDTQLLTGTLTVSNLGDGDLEWTAATDSPNVTLESSSGATPATVLVTVDPAGLPAGLQIGTITLTPADPALAPATVTYYVNVVEGAPAEPADGDPQESGAADDAAQPNLYNVENQWGGDDAPWNPGGVWVIGGRADQRVVALTASSFDGGENLVGTMTYAGEGPIGFRAFRTAQNTYEVENQWGGDDAPWNPGGTWVLGGRDEQSVVDIAIASEDDGSTLAGVMTYDGEGPIGFRAFLGDGAAAPAAEEPATAEAPAPSCDPAAIPPSADTGVMLRFVNNSAAMGFVYWLDFDNQLQEYAILAPGESYDQATFEGHQWEVYDANPQEVDDASTHLMISYTASAEPGQCVVIER